MRSKSGIPANGSGTKPHEGSSAAPYSQFKRDPKNANVHTERGMEMLSKSLRAHGAGRSVLVDKNGVVVAGNATIQRAEEMGLGVRVVETDGQELVVVKRTDVDIETPAGRAMALADNRVAEVNLQWDIDVLREMSDQGADLTDLWGKDELAEMFAGPEAVPDSGPALGGLEYRVIVDCIGEAHQADMIARLESEGLKCRPLIS